MLRLRIQLAGQGGDEPNRLRLDDLNDIDRRMLKESFRLARMLHRHAEVARVVSAALVDEVTA